MTVITFIMSAFEVGNRTKIGGSLVCSRQSGEGWPQGWLTQTKSFCMGLVSQLDEKQVAAKMIGSQSEMKKVNPLGLEMEMCLASPGNISEEVGR